MFVIQEVEEEDAFSERSSYLQHRSNQKKKDIYQETSLDPLKEVEEQEEEFKRELIVFR